MTVDIELAQRAGLLAARAGKPLISCPYDPDGEQAAQALAFVRGWTSAGETAQTAATDSFERGGHVVTVNRGAGGRFGRGSRLGDVMHAVAGVDDDDEADSVEFEERDGVKRFDWGTRLPDGAYQLDIEDTVPREPDEDEEGDEDEDEDEEEEFEEDDYRGFARLRMSPSDMKRFAAGLSASLLVHQMQSSPMRDDDPNRPLIAALVANTPMELAFENEWGNQSIFWGLPNPDGSVKIIARDEDDDEATFTLTLPELRKLHAQLVRQNMEEDDNPYLKRRRAQTAAIETITRDEHTIKVNRGAKGRFVKMSAVAQALQDSGNAADSLAAFDRPALMREAKRRNLALPRGASADDVRQAILEASRGPEVTPSSPADLQRAALTKLNVPALKMRAQGDGHPFTSKVKKGELIDMIMSGPRNPDTSPREAVEWTDAEGVVHRGEVISRTQSSAKVKWDEGRVELVKLKDKNLRFQGAPASAKADRINAAPPAKPKSATRGMTPQDLEAVHDDIDAMVARPKPIHRDVMNSILEGMTLAQLKEVAARHNTSLDGTVSTKKAKANRLTEHLIGYKLDAGAIERVIMGDGDRARSAEQAARDRQAAIDVATSKAEFLADLEEALNNDSSIEELRRMTNQALRIRRLSGDPRAEGLAGVVATSYDPGEIRRALNTSTAAQGMRRIDAGEPVFDPAQHTPIGKLTRGEPVELVRPGYTTTINGEEVTLSRPTVAAAPDDSDDLEIAQARQQLQAAQIAEDRQTDPDSPAARKARAQQHDARARLERAGAPEKAEPEPGFGGMSRSEIDAMIQAGDDDALAWIGEKGGKVRTTSIHPRIYERLESAGLITVADGRRGALKGSYMDKQYSEHRRVLTLTDAGRAKLAESTPAAAASPADLDEPAPPAERDRTVRRRAAARQAGADSPMRALSGSELQAALENVGAGDDAAVRGALDGRDLAELVQIARDMPTVQMPPRQNRTALVDAIVRGTAGFKANAAAQGGVFTGERDNFSAPGARPEPVATEAAIRDAAARYRRDLDEVSARMADRLARRHAATPLTGQQIAAELAAIEADRVPPAPVSTLPTTSPVNASSLKDGDQLLMPNNERVTVRRRQRVQEDGRWVQQLTIEDSNGQLRDITTGLNTPHRRIVGVTGGGGGTFALSDGVMLLEDVVRGTEAPYEQAEFAMPEQLAEYWVHGEGAARVRWFVRGAFRRARRLLRQEGVPEHMLDGAVANLYRRATGKHPGKHRRGDRQLAAGAQVAGAAAMECAAELAAAADVSPHMGWSGPLAPIDIATGDKRRFEPGALVSRQLPLPLMWQKHRSKGHDGAVTVGAMTSYDLAPDGSIIKAAGYFLDPARIPEVTEAMHLVKHQVVGPSVDLGPGMKVAFRSATSGEFNPNACSLDGSCPDDGEAVITYGEIVGATLVPIAAFAEARAPRLFERTTADDDAVMAALSSQTAAVASHWDDIAIAPVDTPWAGDGPAREQLLAWSVAEPLPVGEAETDFDLFRLGFLHVGEHLDEENAYSLPIAAVIDGELQIVPQAVFAAAMRLDTLPVSSAEKTALRGQLDDLYDQMAEALGDDTLQPPWQLSAAADEGCGCAEKWAKAAQVADAGAYGVFGDMAPYDHSLFAAKLDAPTPMTVTEDGRVFGHAFLWSTCNRGHRGMCLRAPKSATGYKEFHLGAVRTDKGLLPVGKIVMGEGHADIEHGTRITRAFYDATSKTVALGRITEDQFGGAFAGVLAPGVTPAEATMLLASPPSGDWRNRELIAVLAVNVPGHVVARAEVTAGEPVNMVAAGRWHDDLEEFAGDVEESVLEAAAMVLAGEAFAAASVDDLREASEQLWAAQAVTIASVLGEGDSQ
jgi:hypothetical protein